MSKKIILLFIIFIITNSNVSEPITEFSPEIAKYFINLSGYAYCPHDNIVKNKCCSNFIETEQWRLIFAEHLKNTDFNYVILSNERLKKIVVGFPGTRKATQLLEEAYKSDGVPFLNDSMQVMEYFGELHKKMTECNIGKKIRALVDLYPDYQVIFLGHSLGGAMATIMALDAVLNNYVHRTESSPMLLTYGQPRTGNDIFANEVMKNIPVVFRVVREGDIVANIPLCAVKKFFFWEDCESVLPENKFDSEFEMTEKKSKKFRKWHIGGLIHFNEEMTDSVNCGNQYGENHKDEKCKLKKSLNVRKHDIYFEKKLKYMCLE